MKNFLFNGNGYISFQEKIEFVVIVSMIVHLLRGNIIVIKKFIVFGLHILSGVERGLQIFVHDMYLRIYSVVSIRKPAVFSFAHSCYKNFTCQLCLQAIKLSCCNFCTTHSIPQHLQYMQQFSQLENRKIDI